MRTSLLTALFSLVLALSPALNAGSQLSYEFKFAAPNLRPIAGFQMSSSGQSAIEGQYLAVSVPTGGSRTVTFDARTRSSDADGQVVGWQWTIDGHAASTLNTFSKALGIGVHTVTLAVTDNVGATSAIAQGAVTVTVALAGLVGHWSFDEADISGTVAYDLSGNANHGTIAGAVSTTGVLGQALQFNGASLVQMTTRNLPIGDVNRTLSGWIRIDAMPPSNVSTVLIRYGRYAWENAMYGLWVWPTLQPYFSQWGDSVTSPAPIDIGSWYHLAAVNVGNHVSLYINGVLAQTGENIMGTLTGGDDFFVGGGSRWENSFQGAIDDIRLYDRALSASEINSIYAAHPIGHPERISFFDSFGPASKDVQGQLRFWKPRGDCSAAAAPGPTVFCPGAPFVDTSVDDRVTLRGQVEYGLRGGVRKGSEIVGPKLPVVGTFAARVTLTGYDDGTNGNASIKSFFTSTPEKEGAPCQHVEQDFEVITGSSKLYSHQGWVDAKGWGRIATLPNRIIVPNWQEMFRQWTKLSPIMANVTHSSKGGGADAAACPEATELFDLQLTPTDPPKSVSYTSNFSLKTPLMNLLENANTITVLVTVELDAVEPCKIGQAYVGRKYRSTYYAGIDALRFVKLGTTRTCHDTSSIDGVTPIFNLWWLDPANPNSLPWFPSDPATTLSSSSLQSIDVSWFYWHKGILPFAEAHKKGMQCDASGMAGEGTCN